MIKKAIITGINGQDGSYLAELLISKKYKVYGVINPKNSNNKKNLKQFKKKISFLKVNLNKFNDVKNMIIRVKPNEIYHLAGQSFVNYNFNKEFFNLNPNINGTHYLLSSIKDHSKDTRFYYAASSELFGKTSDNRQNEKTFFNPRSAYGISKVTGYYLTKNYREAHKLYACSGILFNHESPRRNINFISRKITYNLSRIIRGDINKFSIGNIKSQRDWGHAKDYVFAMWKMLQLKRPEDFVIGTGKLHSVQDFLKIAFNYCKLDYKKYINISKKFYRNDHNNVLRADFKKAKKILKWKPKISFKSLVEEMVKNDLNN